MPTTPAPSTVLPEWAWRRHANPYSGWSRLAATPALVYAVYHREPRVLVAALVWTVLNPVVFPPPESTSSWMTRGVLAEREWLRAGNRTIGTDWPNVLNLLALPATVYLGWAAFRRRPVHAVVATVLSMGLKLAWVNAVIDLTGVSDRETLDF